MSKIVSTLSEAELRQEKDSEGEYHLSLDTGPHTHAHTQLDCSHHHHRHIRLSTQHSYQFVHASSGITECKYVKNRQLHAQTPDRLSLAIPSWVGAMSTSDSWGINRHTSLACVVSQCKLVSGWGLRKRRSVPPYGPCSLGKTSTFHK